MEGLLLMAGRRWTNEELVLLEELTEKYPLDTVARKLGRTPNAVFLKRQRLGIGGLRDNSDMLTRNTLSQILGVENRTIVRWERKGLKAVRKRPYIMYRHQDIIKYLREHPDDWNASRVTDDTLFMQYDWFKEKRKKDIPHKYNWTQTEVDRLKYLRHQGYSIREIAEMMNRSESSIKYKLYRGEQ
jgi:DNA-binding XRE family transcriptional regulator